MSKLNYWPDPNYFLENLRGRDRYELASVRIMADANNRLNALLDGEKDTEWGKRINNYRLKIGDSKQILRNRADYGKRINIVEKKDGWHVYSTWPAFGRMNPITEHFGPYEGRERANLVANKKRWNTPSSLRRYS